MRKSIFFIFFLISCNLLSMPNVIISQQTFTPNTPRTLQQEPWNTWYNQGIIHFYGVGTLFELNLSIDYFFNDTFIGIENENFRILNRVGTDYNLTMSGCYLSDIFEKINLLAVNATHIQFEASDYRTFPLPLRLLEIYPDMVIIVTHENGELIPPKEEDGDGPLKSTVKLEAIQDDPEMQAIFQQNCAPGEDFVHNSKYLVKNLCAINILSHTPYNLTTTDTTKSSTSGINQIDGFQIDYIIGFVSLFIILCISVILKKRREVHGKFAP